MWTGSEMVVWGGAGGMRLFEQLVENTSSHGHMDPHKRRPTCLSADRVTRRSGPAAEMIVWGGFHGDRKHCSTLVGNTTPAPIPGRLPARPAPKARGVSQGSLDGQRNDRLGLGCDSAILTLAGNTIRSRIVGLSTRITNAPKGPKAAHGGLDWQ